MATPDGVIRAVTFVVTRENPRYVRRLDPERIARHIATRLGRAWVRLLDYLHRTLESLDALGLNDRMMREVHRLCVERAAAEHASYWSTTHPRRPP